MPGGAVDAHLRRRPQPRHRSGIDDRPTARGGHQRKLVLYAQPHAHNKDAVEGPANYLSPLVNHARAEGFVVMDYVKEYGKAAQEMIGWLTSGEVKGKKEVVEGFERFPEALLKLFNGEKVLKV